MFLMSEVSLQAWLWVRRMGRSVTREREMRESDNRLRALRPRGGGGGFEAQQLAGGVGGAITCSLFLVLAVRLGCEVYALKNIGVPRP
jgi:hypothetical protein